MVVVRQRLAEVEAECLGRVPAAGLRLVHLHLLVFLGVLCSSCSAAYMIATVIVGVIPNGTPM